jgi:hypothetical protein
MHKVLSVFTSHCMVAASNSGRSPSSGFPNCPQPQLPASHFSQPQLSTDSTNNCQSQSQSHIATDGQSVSLDVEPQTVWQLRSCFCGASALATQVKVKVTLRRRSVRLSVLVSSPRCFFLFESYCPVHVGRPLWREVGSVICQSESVVLVHCHLYNYLQFYC